MKTWWRLCLLGPLGVLCAIFFVWHSIALYHAQRSQTTTASLLPSEGGLPLPAIVICNRFPFNQAGVTSVNANLNQGYILRYLQQWMNPSIAHEPDFVRLDAAQLHTAEEALRGVFAARHVSRIEEITNQCQDVINSCTMAGQIKSSYDCCEHIRTGIGTLKGICWLLDSEDVQSDINDDDALQLTFQVTRNSYHSSDSNDTVHPGIDIYLVNHALSPERLATELPSTPAVRLADKHGYRVRARRQVTTDLTRPGCGSSVSEASAADLNSSELPFLACLLTTVRADCGCVPLFASFVAFDPHKFHSVVEVINSSAVCSVAVYESCARKYVNYAVASNSVEPVSRNSSILAHNVNNCRSVSHRPCQKVDFSVDVNTYSLPTEFHTTADFVSQVSVTYETLQIRDVRITTQPGVLAFFTMLGYNFALWFVVWLVLKTFAASLLDLCSSRVKIAPRNNVTYITPVEEIKTTTAAANSHSTAETTTTDTTDEQQRRGGPPAVAVISMDDNQDPRRVIEAV